MGERIVLKGGKICMEDFAGNGDVVIENGCMSIVCGKFVPEASDMIFDVTGMVITRGLADVHVHLREPGFSYKETIETGTLAAAHGGYTTICAMPNLNPVPDSLEHLEVQLELIRRKACIDVLPYATITIGRSGRKTVDFATLKPYVAGFSDDGNGVQDENVMLRAMEKAAECDALIAAHCEVNSLLEGGCIHDGEYARRNGFKGICSESEWREVERDIELSRKTGCRLHICHVSTKESVELIRRAKNQGLKVTCETAPHYLTMCEEDLHDEGRFKMNPPLRGAADMDALIEGIKDGTIDIIATDHAPHSSEEKSRGLKGSAMGVVGLETAFPVVYSRLVKTGVISFEHMLKLMSYNPLRIFRLYEEEKADLTVFDMNAEYDIDSSEFLSMGHSTPFEGWHVYGKTMLTISNGKVVYKDGKLKVQ